jgi:hypothetical protein
MARTQGSHASGTGAIRLDQVTEAKHPVLHGAPLHKRGERGNGGLSCGRNVPAVPARLPQVASNCRPRCVAQPFQFAGKPVRRASCPRYPGPVPVLPARCLRHALSPGPGVWPQVIFLPCLSAASESLSWSDCFGRFALFRGSCASGDDVQGLWAGRCRGQHRRHFSRADGRGLNGQVNLHNPGQAYIGDRPVPCRQGRRRRAEDGRTRGKAADRNGDAAVACLSPKKSVRRALRDLRFAVRGFQEDHSFLAPLLTRTGHRWCKPAVVSCRIDGNPAIACQNRVTSAAMPGRQS